jgi:hypothetical protein
MEREIGCGAMASSNWSRVRHHARAGFLQRLVPNRVEDRRSEQADDECGASRDVVG